MNCSFKKGFEKTSSKFSKFFGPLLIGGSAGAITAGSIKALEKDHASQLDKIQKVLPGLKAYRAGNISNTTVIESKKGKTNELKIPRRLHKNSWDKR